MYTAQLRACEGSRVIPLPLRNLARAEHSQFPLKIIKLQELKPCLIFCFLCKLSYFFIIVKTSPSFYFPRKRLLVARQTNCIGVSETVKKIHCEAQELKMGVKMGTSSSCLCVLKSLAELWKDQRTLQNFDLNPTLNLC